MIFLLRIYLVLILFFVISCSRPKIESVLVKSEPIDNFSNINYLEYPSHPYFRNITKLPHSYSLGDFIDFSSILFLTESANIYPFDDENLKYFLTVEELETAFETFIDSSYTEPKIRRIKYYPYARLVTKRYVLLIINQRKNDSNGRSYQFDIRTYKFNGELISNLPLAIWDDENDIYCAGQILPGMTIKRNFKNGKIDHFFIEQNGLITEP